MNQRSVEQRTSEANEGQRAGKVRTAVLLWALGIPLPLVLIFVLIRGCV